MPHGINFDWWCAAAVKFRKNGKGVWFRMLRAHDQDSDADAADAADAAAARQPLCSRTLCTITRLLAGSGRSMVTQGQLMQVCAGLGFRGFPQRSVRRCGRVSHVTAAKTADFDFHVEEINS